MKSEVIKLIDIKYDDKGLVPVIAQDAETKEVLMLAYANRDAVELTLSSGYAHYYSRSRNKIWKKGEESGHLQQIHDIFIDCDEDAVIYLVTQVMAACHTGYRSCFYRKLDGTVVGDRLFDPEEVYSKGK